MKKQSENISPVKRRKVENEAETETINESVDDNSDYWPDSESDNGITNSLFIKRSPIHFK